jgi:hypothetical protein
MENKRDITSKQKLIKINRLLFLYLLQGTLMISKKVNPKTVLTNNVEVDVLKPLHLIR